MNKTIVAPNLLVIPNLQYFFVDATLPPLRIVGAFKCKDAATVYITAGGAFGYEFYDSGQYASLEILRYNGVGPIPDDITQNKDKYIALQEARAVFMNFITAAIFGRICGQQNTSLSGMIYNGLDSMTNIIKITDELEVFGSSLDTVFTKKKRSLDAQWMLHAKEVKIFNNSQLQDAIQFAIKRWEQNSEFTYADLPACMAMNYQAAILHNQQHASASLALSVGVLESLSKEVFYAYGLVGKHPRKPYAKRSHTIPTLSNNQFNDKTFANQLEMMRDGGLIDNYLFDRCDTARTKRNNALHKGGHVSSRESGEALTAVRDVWALLISSPFELSTSWTFKILNACAT